MKNIKNMFKHATVKNSAWIIGERVIQMIISFIITMISARYLGPSNYGVLSYGASFVTFFTAIVKLGLDGIIVKELIDNPDKEGKLLGTSLFFRIISSFISILLILLCVYILKPNNKLIIVTSFLQSIALVFQALSFLDYWYQSKLKSKYVSIAKSLSYIMVSAYKFFLLFSKADIKWFALSNAFDYFLICILLFIFYKFNKGPKLQIDYKLGINLLKKSYHFIISGIMVVIYTQIDKIMIGSILDETSVGIYAAALSLHTAYSFLPDAIITSARPTVFNALKQDRSLYKKRLMQTFCLVFWLCFICSFGITIFSKLIIDVVYGEKYLNAMGSLLILAWAVPFSNIGNVRGIWIVGEEKQKYAKKYLILSTILNIILNAILISKIGIAGAAVATLITEIFQAFIAPLFYKDTIEVTKIALNGIFFKFNMK